MTFSQTVKQYRDREKRNGFGGILGGRRYNASSMPSYHPVPSPHGSSMNELVRARDPSMGKKVGHPDYTIPKGVGPVEQSPHFTHRLPQRRRDEGSGDQHSREVRRIPRYIPHSMLITHRLRIDVQEAVPPPSSASAALNPLLDDHLSSVRTTAPVAEPSRPPMSGAR